MIEFIRYLVQCCRAYWEPLEGDQPTPGVTYFALTYADVATFTCLIARGREAWILQQLAYELRHRNDLAVVKESKT